MEKTRLIDANALIADILNTNSEVMSKAPYDDVSFTLVADRQYEIISIIKKQPTVNAVERPICRNCLYYYKNDDWEHCETCTGSSINAFVPYKPGDATK